LAAKDTVAKHGPTLTTDGADIWEKVFLEWWEH